METLIDLFKSLEKRSDKTAIIYRTGVRRFSFSYLDIFKQSLKFAGYLKARDIAKGDKILIWAPNSPWWVVAYFGSIVSGAVVVPVDFASGLERAEKIAELTKAKLIIQSQYKFEKFEKSGSAINIEEIEYLDVPEKPFALNIEINPSDLALLIYTSGTTGDPKGVMLTHKNLMTNLRQVNSHISVNSEYNFLSLLPLSHMFEQICGFLSPLYLGGSIIYIRTLKPSAILQAFEEEDVYVAVLVPRLLQLLKSSIEKEFQNKKIEWLMPALGWTVRKKFGKNFKFFVSGGAALDVATGRFWQKLGFKVIEGYGLTETSPILTANTLTRQTLGTVGVPLPNVQIKLLEGEILAKGDNVFKGYYENMDATEKVFTRDQWFKTGDLGEFDSHGNLKIKGRSKDIIVTGAGINVYPSDVESVLSRVAGVKECCVLGIDYGSGDEVYATFILESSEYKPEEIVQQANTKLDPEQKITSYSIWPHAEFPKTTTLKIQKFLVKKEIENKNAAHPDEISKDKLINLIGRVTGKPISSITDSSVIVRDLGLTSIARLELVNLIELEYRMDLDDNMVNQDTTVADLRRTIAEREKYKVKSYLKFWPNRPIARVFRAISDAVLTYPIFKHYVKLSVEGDEVFKTLKPPVIFISNHQSYGDHTSIYFALKEPWHSRMASAAKEEFFFSKDASLGLRILRYLFFWMGISMLNLFTLSRTGGFRETVNFMGKLADNGISILLFPEGVHSRTGELLPFKLGIGIIVKELKIPVVPIKVTGIEKVLHEDMSWPVKGWSNVKFGKPVVFTKETPDEIVEKCRQAILKL